MTAKLNISEVAKLKKGKIFELDFSVFSEKNNTKEFDRKEYYWVTENKIYTLNPPKGFDDKKYVKNGVMDYSSYAKDLEESGGLPDNSDTLLRCNDRNIKISNQTLISSEIIVNREMCKYSLYHSGNSSFETLEWKNGEGLIHYAWGYGAKKYGMDLALVE